MFNFVSPEKVGFNSIKLKLLKDHLNDNNLRIHTLMIAKGNNIFFNINNEIYNKYSIHRMYSQTKSLVSLAIGLLYDDKKIKLTDKLSSYFPEYINKNTDKVLLNQTIEDTLKMGTCITCDSWFDSKINDRVKLYFKQKHNRKCNQYFEYDSAGSMVLSALVEKLTKKDLFSFLYERILKHLNYFKDTYILKTPYGRSWGDSGLMCSTIAMLSLGRFMLNLGKVGNQQLLSKEYIKKATKKYLSTNKETMKCKRYGYGYQIWMIKDGYAFFGMGNQITLMYPKLDVVVSMTGNCFDYPNGRDYIIDEIYKTINKKNKYNKIELKNNNIIDLFINKKLNNELFTKYKNIKYKSNNKIIKSFIIKNKNIIININNKDYKIDLVNKTTTKSKIKDIYSNQRIVKFPKYNIYDIYFGLENSTKNSILIQGQILGDYFGIIKIKIEFKNTVAILKIKTYSENFLNKYNGCFKFKQTNFFLNKQ